jgi:hypothetical protein
MNCQCSAYTTGVGNFNVGTGILPDILLAGFSQSSAEQYPRTYPISEVIPVNWYYQLATFDGMAFSYWRELR